MGELVQAMDSFRDLVDILAIASMMLMILLNTHCSFCLTSVPGDDDEDYTDNALEFQYWESSLVDIDAATWMSLNHFTLFNILGSIDKNLGYWVKLRSTT